jgi:hypothetical protein
MDREVISMDLFTIAIGIVVLGAAVVFFRRVAHPGRRARFLKRAGIVVMGVPGGFLLLFVVGEMFTDPGGLQAAGLVAAWFVPLIVIMVLAWTKPAWGVPTLATLTAAAVALIVWRALDPGLRGLEDRIGPFTTIAVIALAVATTALAHRRVFAAGVILVVLGLTPVITWFLMTSDRAGLGDVYVLVGSPLMLAGVLFLLSDLVGRRTAPPGEGTRPRVPPAIEPSGGEHEAAA